MPQTMIEPDDRLTKDTASGPTRGTNPGLEHRVLVLAPFGRDASEICRVLGEMGIGAENCPNVEHLCDKISQGAAAALLAEEGLGEDDRRRITAVLSEQPVWSDLPLLVMASRQRQDCDAWRALGGIGERAHLTLLERPLHVATLVTAIGAAIRSRRQQYRIRDELSARRQAEEKLQEERDRLWALVSSIQDEVWFADAAGQFTLVNPAAAREFQLEPGFTKDVRSFAASLEVLRPDGTPRPAEESPPLRALGGEIVTNQEEVIRTLGTGELRYRQVSATPVRDADGNILGSVSVARDVTDRKQAEEALWELNETLETQVAERTAVAEARAKDLRSLASELNEAEHRERTRLARLLHDDLQQLLLAMKLRLPVLVEGDPSQLEQHVNRLNELVDECLSISRDLTQELSPPVLQYGSLPELFEWLGRWFGEKHELAVTVEPVKESPAVPDHLRVFLFQAVRELLVNVMKHSGSMNAHVSVSCRNGRMTVAVEDGGKSFVPASVESRLQCPEGFGLFNIRERLEALAGCMEVEVTQAGGACFRLVIPIGGDARERPEDGVTKIHQTQMPITHIRDRHSKGETVRLLVADDHAVVREGFVSLLNLQPDLEVVGEATDGQEAIRQAEVLRPDAIVMDLEMPTMDGVEATRRIKEHQPEVIIVGLSLHDEASAARAMAEAGADAFVSKHAPAKDLVEAIRQTCSQHGSDSSRPF